MLGKYTQKDSKTSQAGSKIKLTSLFSSISLSPFYSPPASNVSLSLWHNSVEDGKLIELIEAKKFCSPLSSS